MYWKLDANGTYRQPVDSISRWMYRFTHSATTPNREHWIVLLNISFRSSCSKDYLLPKLQHAWLSLRFEQPALAATTDPDTLESLYSVASSIDVDRWLAESFVISSGVEDLFKNIESTPLHTRLLYYPESQNIVIQTNHWRTDGRGTVLLANRLLELLVSDSPRSFSWGTEVERLPPSLDQLINRTTDEATAAKAYAQRFMNEIMENSPPLGTEYAGNEATEPSAYGRLDFVFSSEHTQSLVEACRRHGFTVTQACHAACVLATRRLASDHQQKHTYAAFSAVDFRKYMPAPYNTDHFATAQYFGGPFIFAQSTLDFHKTAATFQAQAKAFSAEQYMKSLPETVDLLVKKLPSPSFSSEITISSIGVLDPFIKKNYGDVEILDAALGVTSTTRSTLLHVWTWRGRLRWGANFNTAYHSFEDIKAQVALVAKVLADGLEVLLEPSIFAADV